MSGQNTTQNTSVKMRPRIFVVWKKYEIDFLYHFFRDTLLGNTLQCKLLFDHMERFFQQKFW